MSDTTPREPNEADPQGPAPDLGAVPSPAPPAGDPSSEVLDQLESDLASVQTALESLDRITSGPMDESSAPEIAAVVSAERFPIDTDEESDQI